MNIKSFIFSFLIFSNTFACAQNEKKTSNENYQIVVPDLINPWGFTFLPDKSILINEKEGKLIHFKDGIKNTISGLPEIYVSGQGGLMDIVLHPNYEINGWIYISYASSLGPGNGGNTAIMRGKLKNNQFINKQLLYKAIPNTTAGQHFGSRIVFDNNGFLYFSIGELKLNDGKFYLKKYNKVQHLLLKMVRNRRLTFE